jgi:transcriptional regulator with XRE-family HTH domain
MTPAAIRKMRKSLGLSPEELASRLGFVGKNRRITVWRWETGNRVPSAQTITLIKHLLKEDA